MWLPPPLRQATFNLRPLTFDPRPWKSNTPLTPRIQTANSAFVIMLPLADRRLQSPIYQLLFTILHLSSIVYPSRRILT